MFLLLLKAATFLREPCFVNGNSDCISRIQYSRKLSVIFIILMTSISSTNLKCSEMVCCPNCQIITIGSWMLTYGSLSIIVLYVILYPNLVFQKEMLFRSSESYLLASCLFPRTTCIWHLGFSEAFLSLYCHASHVIFEHILFAISSLRRF